MKETDIQVFEGDDALVKVRLQERDADGVLQPFDLSTFDSLEFVVKADRNAVAAMFTYTSPTEITITDAAGGRFEIQFDATDLATPGKYRHRVRTVEGTAKNTVMFGDLIVENV